MGLIDIRKLDKVVDRLAVQGPSGVSAVHCWICGKVEAWFRCDCRGAREAQEKPRWDHERNCIILDEDVIASNVALGYKRYVKPRAKKPPPVHAPAVTPVTTGPPTAANRVTPVTESVTEPGPITAAERMRRMRKRRAKQKEGSDG